MLLRLGRQQPVVLLFEDLHWVDPSTQEQGFDTKDLREAKALLEELRG